MKQRMYLYISPRHRGNVTSRAVKIQPCGSTKRPHSPAYPTEGQTQGVPLQPDLARERFVLSVDLVLQPSFHL